MIILYLGGLIKEVEINCVKMVVDELIQYLEIGNMINVVNLLDVVVLFISQYCFMIIYCNIFNMLG